MTELTPRQRQILALVPSSIQAVSADCAGGRRMTGHTVRFVMAIRGCAFRCTAEVHRNSSRGTSIAPVYRVASGETFHAIADRHGDRTFRCTAEVPQNTSGGIARREESVSPAAARSAKREHGRLGETAARWRAASGGSPSWESKNRGLSCTLTRAEGTADV